MDMALFRPWLMLHIRIVQNLLHICAVQAIVHTKKAERVQVTDCNRVSSARSMHSSFFLVH